MKEWFIEHYAEIRYWEMIGSLILLTPFLIYWIVEKHRSNKKKDGKD